MSAHKKNGGNVLFYFIFIGINWDADLGAQIRVEHLSMTKQYYALSFPLPHLIFRIVNITFDWLESKCFYNNFISKYLNWTHTLFMHSFAFNFILFLFFTSLFKIKFSFIVFYALFFYVFSYAKKNDNNLLFKLCRRCRLCCCDCYWPIETYNMHKMVCFDMCWTHAEHVSQLYFIGVHMEVLLVYIFTSWVFLRPLFLSRFIQHTRTHAISPLLTIIIVGIDRCTAVWNRPLQICTSNDPTNVFSIWLRTWILFGYYKRHRIMFINLTLC